MQHLAIDIIARIGVIEARVYFAAYQVVEDIRVQAKASGKFSGLTRGHVQIDIEIAIAAIAQVAIVLVGAFG